MIDLKPACRRMIDLLVNVTDDQVTNPSPCTEYTVGDLIDHVDEVSMGFAAVADKRSVEQADTDGSPASTASRRGDDWPTMVPEHVRVLGEAWDNPAAWQGSTDAAGLELSNELWGKIALTEMVVHGWDIARATGQAFDLPEDTLRACLDHVATFVPAAPVPALWGPPVAVPTDAPLLHRIVAITGRTP